MSLESLKGMCWFLLLMAVNTEVSIERLLLMFFASVNALPWSDYISL